MNKLLLFCVASFAASVAQADIYTWVDAQGVRHYSDSAAHGGAKRANLSGLQSADGNPQALEQLRAMSPSANAGSRAESADSRLPRILRPQSEETFRDAQGIVPVSVTIGGADGLRDGEQITYYLDGSPIPQSPTDQTTLQLGNVPRGSHTLSAALLYQGREIRRTEPVTFYMQPPSAISPLNANQGGGASDSETPSGSVAAPPAGNSSGAPAAPRFNTTTGSAGQPPS